MLLILILTGYLAWLVTSVEPKNALPWGEYTGMVKDKYHIESECKTEFIFISPPIQYTECSNEEFHIVLDEYDYKVTEEEYVSTYLGQSLTITRKKGVSPHQRLMGLLSGEQDG